MAIVEGEFELYRQLKINHLVFSLIIFRCSLQFILNLFQVNSTIFPQDVLDIVTYLLKGTTLVAHNVTINPDLLKTRESPAVMRGNCTIHSINNQTVFAFIR